MSSAKAGDFFLHYIYGCKKVVKIELYAIETLKSVDLLAVMRSGVRTPYAPPISMKRHAGSIEIPTCFFIVSCEFLRKIVKSMKINHAKAINLMH